MFRSLILACCLMSLSFSNAFAQKNEFSFIVGGGKLSGSEKSINASAATIAYTRSLFKGLAVEGSLDIFYVKTPGINSDDFIAAQIGAIYHFGSIGKSRRIIPYITAGVGKVSTAPGEIPAVPVYRFGGGIKYYFSEAESSLGIRIEVRDEIIRNGNGYDPLTGSRLSLVTLRGGVIYRF